MASQAQMDRLLGKALFDDTFRSLLLKEPERAAGSLRYKLTEAQLAHIRRLEPAGMDELANRFCEEVDWRPHQDRFTIW